MLCDVPYLLSLWVVVHSEGEKERARKRESKINIGHRRRGERDKCSIILVLLGVLTGVCVCVCSALLDDISNVDGELISRARTRWKKFNGDRCVKHTRMIDVRSWTCSQTRDLRTCGHHRKKSARRPPVKSSIMDNRVKMKYV